VLNECVEHADPVPGSGRGVGTDRDEMFGPVSVRIQPDALIHLQHPDGLLNGVVVERHGRVGDGQQIVLVPVTQSDERAWCLACSLPARTSVVA
jgi:hypothetical protein